MFNPHGSKEGWLISFPSSWNHGIIMIALLDGIIQLVGGIPTPLKNMSSSVGIIIPNIWKNIKNVPTTYQQYNPLSPL
jgi:hypothetical protein